MGTILPRAVGTRAAAPPADAATPQDDYPESGSDDIPF